jgi:hypothetical protein
MTDRYDRVPQFSLLISGKARIFLLTASIFPYYVAKISSTGEILISPRGAYSMGARLTSAFRAFWKNTDNITKWVQVIALVVTAGWVFWRFQLLEMPSSLRRPGVSTNLSSELVRGTNGATCDLKLEIKIENSGLTSFKVSKIQVSGWRLPFPTPSPNTPLFLDAEKIELANTFIRYDYVDPALRRTYLPSTNYLATLSWTIQSAEKDFLYYFKAVALDENGSQIGYGTSWHDNLCR